jgi:hypothetical protein
MSLPANFALLAVNPAIRENDGFLFLQTGQSGYIDLFLQAGSGNPVNILKITSGVSISNTLFVNQNGNDSTAKKYTIDYPYKTLSGALGSASSNDIIEVFPGSYDLNSNLFKDGVTFYFHKNSTVNFLTSGKLHVTGHNDTGVFTIYGNGAFVDAGAASGAFLISGGQVVVEFDYFNCNGKNLTIETTTNQTANVVFRTLGEGLYGGRLIFNDVTVKSESVQFENISVESSTFTLAGTSGKKTVCDNCTFITTETSFANPKYKITGAFEFNNCYFSGIYPKFVSLGLSTVNNTTLEGGIITSGQIYFDACKWDTRNSNLYPNASLISHLGGDTIFANCFVKNRFNTPNPLYSFRPSGSASGASNFNIHGSFSSFLPVASGSSIKYGIFTYNSYLR